MSSRVTHLGLCVRDLERSVAFYEGALGFSETGRLQATGPETDAILGLHGTVLDLVYLERDGWRIELLAYAAGVEGDGTPRPMDRIGFTHLSLRVGSIEELAGPIEAHGGRLLPESMVTFATGNRGAMAVDPDGIRVELIEKARR